MYSYLDVYFEGHLSEVFDRFPQGDGFGVLEAIRKRLRTRSEALERLVKREWDDLQMDKGFPKGHCNFIEFKKNLWILCVVTMMCEFQMRMAYSPNWARPRSGDTSSPSTLRCASRKYRGG